MKDRCEIHRDNSSGEKGEKLDAVDAESRESSVCQTKEQSAFSSRPALVQHTGRYSVVDQVMNELIIMCLHTLLRHIGVIVRDGRDERSDEERHDLLTHQKR